jgi:hypothetical protein
MNPPDNKPASKAQPKAASVPAAKKRFEMNSKNFHFILMAGVIFVAILYIATIFLGLSVLSSKSKQLVSLKSQSQAADKTLANLEQSKKDIQKYSYFKQIAKTVIPNDKDQAEAVSEIFKFAQQANIRIGTITFPTSSLGLSKSAVNSGTASGSSASPPSSAITQAVPVSGIPGLYSLTLIITPQTGSEVPANLQVTYPKILAFLKSIEDNRRTAQITQVLITPPEKQGDSFTFTLTVNIFIKT